MDDLDGGINRLKRMMFDSPRSYLDVMIENDLSMIYQTDDI